MVFMKFSKEKGLIAIAILATMGCTTNLAASETKTVVSCDELDQHVADIFEDYPQEEALSLSDEYMSNFTCNRVSTRSAGQSNSSDIGKGTYISATTSTKDRLKSANEVGEVTTVPVSSGESIVESVQSNVPDIKYSGLVPASYTDIKTLFGSTAANNRKFTVVNSGGGSAHVSGPQTNTQTGTSGHQVSITNIDSARNIQLKFENYAYYYKLSGPAADYKLTPVNLIVSIDYVDRYSSNPDKYYGDVIIRMSDSGSLSISADYVDELEISVKYQDAETLKPMYDKVIYQITDIDLTSQVGMPRDQVSYLTTYTGYDYTYKELQEGLKAKYTNGTLTEDKYRHRAALYEETWNNIVSGGSNDKYNIADRSGDRLKYLVNSDYITVFDSWGVNSGEDSTKDDAAVTDGNDSTIAFVSTTSSDDDGWRKFTFNFNNAFYGKEPDRSQPYTQTISLNPRAPETKNAITKSVIDSGSSAGSDNNVLDTNETLTYTISVTNPESKDKTIYVNDSMLNSLPSYMRGDVLKSIDQKGGIKIMYANGRDSRQLTQGNGWKALDGGKTIAIDMEPVTRAVFSYSISTDQLAAAVNNGGNKITNTAEVNTSKGAVTTKPSCGKSTDVCTTVDNVIAKAPTVTKTSKGDGNADEVIERGETMTYTVKIHNDWSGPEYAIPVSDDLISSMPDYATLTSKPTFKYSGSGDSGSGDFLSGKYVINRLSAGETLTITYEITYDDDISRSDATNVTNTVCVGDRDAGKNGRCDSVTDNVNSDTQIQKSLTDENKRGFDGYIEQNELLTYTVKLNNRYNYTAYDITLRDSLMENLPTYLTVEGSPTITGDFNSYTGKLTDKGITFDEIKPKGNVTVTYKLRTSKSLTPDDIEYITNVITDDKSKPDKCTPTSSTWQRDCDKVTEPVNALSDVTKTAWDADKDGYLESNERIYFKIQVKNPYTMISNDTLVRDSLLENTPSYLIDMNDIKVSSKQQSTIKTTGDLHEGNFYIDEINPGATIDITYSMTMRYDFQDDTINFVYNNVSDDDTDPQLCQDEASKYPAYDKTSESYDCDSTETKIMPNTHINKTVKDTGIREGETVNDGQLTLEDTTMGNKTNNDKLLQDFENLTYTIVVENKTSLEVPYVDVRDSLLENMPTYTSEQANASIDGVLGEQYLNLVGDVTITNNKGSVTTTGSLVNGDYQIQNMPAKSKSTITYTIAANDVPDDVFTVDNIVTDNAHDPDVCTSVQDALDNSDASSDNTGILDGIFGWITGIINGPDGILANNAEGYDCAKTSTTVEGETQIETYMIDVDGREYDSTTETNFVLEDGENLEVYINLYNPTESPIKNIYVRNDLAENIPSWMTWYAGGYDEDGIRTSGDLRDGDLIVEEIAAGKKATIKFTLRANEFIPTLDSIDSDANKQIVSTTNDDNRIVGNEEAFTVLENGADYNENYYDTYNNNPSKSTLEDFVYPAQRYNTNFERFEDTDRNNMPIEGMTNVTKIVEDEDGNGVADAPTTNGSRQDPDAGEVLTYTATISNPDDMPVFDVIARDSMLEDIQNGAIDYLKQIGEVELTVYDADGNTVSDDTTTDDSDTISGLFNGKTRIKEIPAGGNAVITYQIKVLYRPEVDERVYEVLDSVPLSSVVNTITDAENGGDTDAVFDQCNNYNSIWWNSLNDGSGGVPGVDSDCYSTSTPFEQDTIISKSAKNQNGNGIKFKAGDTINYQTTVTNVSSEQATDVVIRDSTIEATPHYITLNNDEVISVIDENGNSKTVETTGSLENGDLTITTPLDSGDVVKINYSGDMNLDMPASIVSSSSIATDDGSDTDTCSIPDRYVDCDSTYVYTATGDTGDKGDKDGICTTPGDPDCDDDELCELGYVTRCDYDPNEGNGDDDDNGNNGSDDGDNGNGSDGICSGPGDIDCSDDELCAMGYTEYCNNEDDYQMPDTGAGGVKPQSLSVINEIITRKEL